MIVKTTMSEPWTRQPGESAQAYRALQFFLELGGRRSIEEYAKRLGLRRKDCERWSVQHNWTARARKHDIQQSLSEEQAEPRDKAEAEKWTRRRAEEAEALYQGARHLRDRSAEILRRPLAETMKADGDPTPDGRRLTLRDAAFLEKLASEMAQQALDLAETSRTTGETRRIEARRAETSAKDPRQGGNDGRQVRQAAELKGGLHLPPSRPRAKEPHLIERFAERTARVAGGRWGILAAFGLLLVWAAAGPFLGFSDR